MNQGRTYKSARNALYGVGNQVIQILLGFVSRMIFLRVLNESYLGINSLFTEVLSMLSLVDLGMGTVMVYSLYKPLAEKNEERLKGLMSFYQTVYRIIAIAVAIIGLSIIPFLKYIVNMDSNINYLYVYYCLFLAKTVISYLFVYKTAILNADQNNYLVSKIQSIVRILLTIVQVISLFFTKSYFVYLLFDIAVVFFQNYLCARKAEKLYPFLKVKGRIEKDESREIFQNIRSGFIYKVSSVLLSSTDNTIISVMFGTVLVGYYSNYGMIINKLALLLTTMFGTLSGSIGNLIATESYKKRYEVFSMIQAMSFMISGVSTICLFSLIQDFISLWIGDKFLLSLDVLIACLLNYYLNIVMQPLWVYRDSTGLYRKTKYVMIVTAGINLFLSVAMGYILGLSGVLFASVLSRLLTYFWYEPMILFGEYFNEKPWIYFARQFYNALAVIIPCVIAYFLFYRWNAPNVGVFVVKAIAVFVYAIVSFGLLNIRNKSLGQVIGFFWEKVKIAKL